MRPQPQKPQHESRNVTSGTKCANRTSLWDTILPTVSFPIAFIDIRQFTKIWICTIFREICSWICQAVLQLTEKPRCDCPHTTQGLFCIYTDMHLPHSLCVFITINNINKFKLLIIISFFSLSRPLQAWVWPHNQSKILMLLPKAQNY